MITTTSSQDKDFGTEFFVQIIDWITDYFSPEEVYSETELKNWALDNGYQPIREDY